MKKLLIGAAMAATVSTGAQAATVFGVDTDNFLVTFNSSAPGAFTSERLITGTSATFLALDFRDSNGLLYGLGDDLTLYTIDTATAVASAVGGPLALSGSNFGFDFNTVVDAIRIVSNDDSNYVINADTGTISTVATPVSYGAGDVAAGQNAIVAGNAYLHGTTTQYAIDTNLDTLVMQANNAGTLTTVGALGALAGPRTSFDIDFDNTAYMLDGSRFYTVDLHTGASTLVGTTSRSLYGIAIGSGAVPEPGTWALFILGFGAIGAALRRKSGQSAMGRAKLTYS
ncbi:DUF4394 domain-containing protein [Qipengyuania sp.]|uniref:DUF4394 domain-containing protein n=1 Tax=Qipengyuania sp. TaxID=2004515 RepID=UPI0035C798E4